jgi:hypothetical protein
VADNKQEYVRYRGIMMPIEERDFRLRLQTMSHAELTTMLETHYTTKYNAMVWRMMRDIDGLDNIETMRDRALQLFIHHDLY